MDTGTARAAESFAAVRSLLRAAWRWWSGELSAAAPPLLRRLAGLDLDLLVLDWVDGALAVSHRSKGRERALGRVAADVADRSQALIELLDREGARFHRLVARLPADQVLQKDVTLPLAVEGQIGRVLAYEMDRQTPFRADQVTFYYDVLSRRRLEGTFTVRLTAAPREAVTALLARLAEWGVVPDIVSATDVPAAPGATLLPATFAAPARRAARLNGWLAGLAAVLLVTLVSVPALRTQRALADLEAQLVVARPAAAAAVALRREVDRRAAGVATVARAKAHTPFAVRVLDEMTRLLPDDTWLAQYNLVGGAVEIQGVSSSAAALVGAIESSPLFGAVRFRTPITRDSLTGQEHFNLAIALVAAP